MPHSLLFVPLKKECPHAVRNEAWLFIVIFTELGGLSCTFSPEDEKETNSLYLSKELPLSCAHGWKVQLQTLRTTGPDFSQPV